MKKEKRNLTYGERWRQNELDIESEDRRNFLRSLGAGIIVLAGGAYGISNLDKIKSWAEEQNEKLDQESYLKLRKMVYSETEINAVPERGWQFYAQNQINENPWLGKYTNARELGEFYKVLNGGKQPLLRGKIIEPVFRNPKEGLSKRL